MNTLCRMFLGGIILLSWGAGALEIRGVVQDPEGKPIGGAQVWLLQDFAVRQAPADAQGNFRFDQVRVGGAELVAWKEGWSVGGHHGPVFGDAEVVVRLRPPADIQLRIISSTFFPVPGATVDQMLVNDEVLVSVKELAAAGFPLIRGNDEGMLTIPHLPAGGFVKLGVKHPDFAESTVAYLPVREERQEIVLHPGVKLRGRVTHEAKGVSGAHVWVSQEGAGNRPASHVKTDPEGYFSVRLPEGQYTVAVREERLASPEPAQVRLAEGEEPSVELTMHTARLVRGSVQGPDRQPLPGVEVVIRSGETLLDETLSQEDGSYRLKSPLDEVTLTVVPPAGLMAEALPDVVVKLEKKNEVELAPLVLLELPEIVGVVLDDAGRPVEKAVVSSRDSLIAEEKRKDLPPWAGRLYLFALTDKEGRFRIRLGEVPEARELSLTAEHPLRLLKKRAKVSLDKQRPLEMRLEVFSPDLEPREVAPADQELADLRDHPAPPLEASDWFNTPALSAEQLKGKVVVLHFWAGFDDSPNGLGRLREFMAVHEAMKDAEDLIFIGVHDASSTADEVEEYVQRFGITLPVARDADPFKTFTSHGVVYLPQTVLIDKEGVLRYFQVEGRLMEMIKALRR